MCASGVLPGGDLFEYMAAKRRLCEKEAAIIFRQIASALHHCHERGVVHRDVKPENVLMCAKQTRGLDAEVKLADFGLAVRLGPSRQTTGQAGSAVYMAPEVIKGRAYGCEVDMWSLGVTLYVALSGTGGRGRTFLFHVSHTFETSLVPILWQGFCRSGAERTKRFSRLLSARSLSTTRSLGPLCLRTPSTSCAAC